MIAPATLRFLRQLKTNNNKAWFDEHREAYNSSKANVEAFAEQLILAISKFDKSIAHLQPKDCTFRINRDVRFSANKAPYKTNMAIYLSHKGKQAMDAAGYYLHIEPGASFVAGGLWMPPAPVLHKVRQEIDYNFDSWKKIVQAKKFRDLYGDLDREKGQVLSRPPKGYDAENPAIEYLKLKSFMAWVKADDALLQQPDAAQKVAEQFRVIYPLIAWLNEALAEI